MQGRQGAGRVQGQGTEGRAGLQDSILRFSRAENLKITFLQLSFLEKKGEGRAGQGWGSERLGAGQHRARAKARAKGRAGCRAQAGCGAGHRGQGRVTRFHFEDFQGLKTSKSRFCNFLRRKGKRESRAGFGFRAFRGRAAQGQGQGQG